MGIFLWVGVVAEGMVQFHFFFFGGGREVMSDISGAVDARAKSM